MFGRRLGAKSDATKCLLTDAPVSRGDQRLRCRTMPLQATAKSRPRLSARVRLAGSICLLRSTNGAKRYNRLCRFPLVRVVVASLSRQRDSLLLLVSPREHGSAACVGREARRGLWMA